MSPMAPDAMARIYPEPEPEFPAPLVTSAEDVAGPGKSAVAGLVRELEAVGWTVIVTYAKGWEPNARTGRPGAKPKESLAVRASRGTQRAVAVYTGGATWSWDTMYAWELGRFPTRAEVIGDFRDLVLGRTHGPTLKDARLGPMLGPKKATPAERKAAREAVASLV